MDATTAAAIITDAKDNELEVIITVKNPVRRSVDVEPSTFTGEPVSVNSKGVNLKIDGKVRSFGLNRIVSLVSSDDAEAEAEVANRMEELADEVSEGATTAEVAALLSDYLERDLTPKELRVHLRALGLGVGKGRKYALSAGEFRAVVKVIEATPAN